MNASVIVVGNQITDVLLSAGEVGNGRVVVTTHGGYGVNFTTGTNQDESISTLHVNIKDWLMRGAVYNSSSIMEVSAYLKLTNATAKKRVKILHSTELMRVWTSGQMNIVLSFVRNGGGLFVSTTPWGWASSKGSNDFNLMLTYRTLLEAGIAFNEDYIYDTSVFYFDKPTYLSHLGIQVDIALAPENSQFNYSNSIKVIDQAKHLPNNAIANFHNRISLYLTQAEVESNAPSESTKTTSVYIKSRLLCYQRFSLNGDFNIVAPKHENFPGAVDTSAENFQSVSREYTFTAPDFEQFHHTRLYAVPGQAVTIEVLDALPNSKWQVYIGFHTDSIINHQQWVRWPIVFTRRYLVRNTTFSCGFGGLIYLKSPTGSKETIRIKVGPAVEAPWYDSQDQFSIEDWPTKKNAVGPWGCVQGKWVAFCMPKASFASVDPLHILNTYDGIHVEYNRLRSTNPENERKRYILADIRHSAGYMHAGYPIATLLDVATPSYEQFVFNEASLAANGNWGIFHELGHNMQRSWWTTDVTVEVTVNIFTLRAHEMVTGVRPKQCPWLNNQKEQGLKYLSDPDFNKMRRNAGLYLLIYAQVIEDFGWESMRNVLTSYETGDSSTYPTQEQGVMDFFWSQYSLQVGENLQGLLQKWGIPYTSDFTSRVEGLPGYEERVNLFDP